MLRGSAIVLLLATLVACGDGARDAARRRARHELECPEASLTTYPIGAGGYVTEGCGRRQTYTCAANRSNWICVPGGEVETAPTRRSAGGETTPTLPAATSSSPGDDARVARSVLARCAIDAETTIAIRIAPDGRVGRTDTPGLSPESGTCVVTELRGARFASRSREETAHVALSAHDADRSAATAVATVPTTPSTPPAGEAAARARVDELRAAILSCTSSDAAAVVAEWTAAGALTLRLPDARTGTPEDGCVRALSSGLVLSPAPGTAGTVLHPVH